MDFEKICMMFTMQEPYYGILLSSMNRVPTNIVPTIGVGKNGNVFTLYYNEEYMKKQSIDNALTILKHECLHLAFNHFSLWEEETNDVDEHTLRNCAEDLEVNSYLDASHIKELNGLLASNYGWANSLGTREYYSLLKKELDAQSQQQQPTEKIPSAQQSPNGQSSQSSNVQSSNKDNTSNDAQEDNQSDSSSGSDKVENNSVSSGKASVNDVLHSGEMLDDHSQWPNARDAEEAQSLESQINTMLEMAAVEVEKNRGTIPAELRGKIESIRKKPKPVADWKRYFRRYLGNEFTELLRKSKKRESKRFPDAAGNRHQRKSNILVAIDTSGSVSMPEYKEFFGQLKTLTSRANFHVVECDACIQHEYDYRNAPNEILHGGGGTSFQPPIDMFLKNRKLYDALVYFTDGYATIPSDTPKDTIWVISSNGDQSSRKRYQVNGAKVAFIPKHN